MEMAASIWKTGRLEIENQYVLSYPGFSLSPDGNAIGHFLPGYPTYLAFFFGVFGIYGFAIGNAVLVFLGLLFIFLTAKEVSNEKIAASIVFLFVFTYYTIYFSRSSYSEIMLLTFFWASAYSLAIASKYSLKDPLISGILLTSFIVLVRPEGILYLICYIVTSVFIIKKKRALSWASCESSFFPRIIIKKYPIMIRLFSIVALIVISIAILWSYLVNPHLANALEYPLHVIENPGNTISINSPYNEQMFIFVYLIAVLTPIGTIPFLFIGISFSVFDRDIRSKILPIILLALPQFGFLIKPSIAFYLPWFMRRFWPILIPLAIFTYCIVIDRKLAISTKKAKKIGILLIVVPGLILFGQTASIIFVKEGQGMLSAQEEFAYRYSNDTSIFIFWGRYKIENYGPPLYFYFDMNIVYDQSPAYDPRAYALFIKDYDSVYLISFSPSAKGIGHPYFDEYDVVPVGNITINDVAIFASTADVRILIVEPDRFSGYLDLFKKSIENPILPLKKTHLALYIYKITQESKQDFIETYYDPNFRITTDIENFWQ